MNEDKILLVKGTSGLGNRIECVLTGILYARLTSRRLIVDWSDHYFSNNGTNIFHRFFQCPLSNPADEIPVTASVNPSIWRGHLHESAPYMREHYGNINDGQTWRTFSVDLRRVDHQEDVLVMWTYTQQVDSFRNHFKGSFQEFAPASSEAILRKLLREDLRLHPQIRKQIDQFKRDFFGRKTVGVHVRYTDHRVRFWSILKKLDALLKREPKLQIFLATDNVQIRRIFEERYPDVITTPHWYASTPGCPIHFGDNRPDPTESGIEALVDLYLLAECNYLIIDTSSSFSYVATLLTNTPAANIVNVKRRGKQSPRRRRLSHQLMLKMGLFSWGLGVLRNCIKIRRTTFGR